MARRPSLGSWMLVGVALCAAAGPLAGQCPTALGDVVAGSLEIGSEGPVWLARGDGVISRTDAAVVAGSVVGRHDLEWEADPSCPQVPGDVAPGWLDDEQIPAVWYPIGDGERDLADVIALLRAAAGRERVSDGLTWYEDVKVVTDDRCARCHVSGGIGPFPVTTWEETEPVVAWMEWAVRERVMPPWPPADDCAPLDHSRALSERDRAVFLSWVAQGARRGDPADEPPPRPGPDPVVYDTRLEMAEPYTPGEGREDDYRCFLMEWPHADQRFVTGMRIDPGRADMVHHVIAFAALPWEAGAIRDLEAEDPEPGWECFGAAGVAAYWLGAWAPGERGSGYPEGTGIRVLDDALIVMQVHYNMENTPPVPDQSAIEFRTATEVDQRAFISLLVGDDFFIPAGEPWTAYEETWTGAAAVDPLILGEIGVAPGEPYRVRTAGLHMHQLGVETSIRMDRADGEGTCVLDIPEWDFHWQGVYELADSLLVEPDDQITLRCAWDNSPENQPEIDGEPREPRDVTWGDGSSDEMCLGILYVTAP